jgi:hypothetical protein
MKTLSKSQGSSKWVIMAIIALIAAGSGVASWLGLFSDIFGPSEENQRITKMQEEISFRLNEIHKFLYQDQMTNRNLYNGTKRIEAKGVGVSQEFKEMNLQTLLFEFEQITSVKNQSYIQSIRNLFEELSELAPSVPFTDSDLADVHKVQSARAKFDRIEQLWQRIMQAK